MDDICLAAKKRAALRAVLAAMVTTWLASSAISEGQVRLSVPEESPSGPFYARIERGLVFQTDQWVAIPFYRDPSCVRPTFNLLSFFDFANIPAIFSCPLTVNGFEIWEDPATDAAPRQSKLQGNGSVPVWFVSVEDFQAALPGLTMTELLGMPSLVQGVATFYEEVLHPAEVARQSKLTIVASGHLPDGRTFNVVGIEAAAELRHVSIVFR